MRSRTVVVAFAIVAALGSVHAAPVSAQAAPRDDATIRAHAMFDEYWEWVLREFPEFATRLGDHRYDDRLADQSAAAVSRRRAHATPNSSSGRAARMPPRSRTMIACRCAFSGTSSSRPPPRTRCARRCRAASAASWSPVTQFNGPQFDLPQLVERHAIFVRSRLRRVPEAPRRRCRSQIDQLIARMETAMKLGWMPAKIAIARVPAQLDAQLDPDPAKNPEYAPFLKFPADIAPAERERLAAAGRQAIKDKVIPAVPAAARLLRPALSAGGERQHRGVRPAARHALITKCGSPRTRRRGCRRRRSTSSGSPRSRASARRWTRRSPPPASRARAPNSRQSINSDPQFFYTKAEDMLAGYRDIAKRADAELPRLFAELPRLPYGIRAMRPEEGDNAEHYSRGAADGSRRGLLRGQRQLAVAAAQVDDGDAGAA